MKSSAKKVELASVDDLFSTEEGRQDAKLEKIQEIPLRRIHFPLFDIGDLLYRNMAQIRKLLLCQVFFLSGFPHFLPQSSQIINRHNRSPQEYCIVPVYAKK